MEKFVYNLREELKYSRDGQPVSTASIEFTAYNMESFDEGTAFEQLVMGAFAGSTKGMSVEEIEKAQELNRKKKSEKGKDNDNDLTASDIKSMLMSSQDVSMSDISGKFKAMALKVANLDSKGTRFTETLFSRLSVNDFMDMICEYIVNFTYPSLLGTEDS